jgi:hypothetical protein
MLSNRSTQGVRGAGAAIVLLALLAWAPRLAATTQGPMIALGWDASTDPTVTGYNVYYGASSRNYTNVLAVGNTTSTMVSNLVTGVTYYFAATTYTADGLESDYSVEASIGIASANNPPTLDPLPDFIIQQDAGVQVVPLTGITSGAANENQTLNISAFSSNPGLIPSPQVAYTSPDTNGTLTFSSLPGSFGSTIITVMVDDGAAVSNTVIRSFMVTVSPVENPPTIDLLNDLVIAENAGLQSVNLSGITSGSTNGTPTLSVTAVSSNPALIATPSINYTSPAAAGTLAFTPATNAVGAAKITVTVTDDQPTNNVTSVSFNVTVNQSAPVPGLLANAVVAPNATFRFLINPPATNGDNFSASLGAGAPAGARVVSRKGLYWLIWTPTTAQASTTNLIGIKITDSSNASLSTNETVQVIVQDYLLLVVGTASIQAGQNGSVSFALSSSEGVTNLSFSIPWPTNSLPGPALSISVPGVASSSLRYQANNAVVTIQMAPGQALQGSNVIGSLSFQSLPSQPSGYINLPIGSLTAAKPSSSLYVNAIPTAGQVAIVNGLVMLQANATSSSGRNLTVLAKVGNSYQVQYCTNFGPSAVWYPLLTYAQTNISQSVTVDPTLGQVFYRIQQK